MKQSRNAHFWAHINGGFVRLTIKPGQPLRWGESRPSEEGYSYQSLSWGLSDGKVTRSSASGGRDCDGRVDFYEDLECPIDQLAVNRYEGGPLTPAWKNIRSSQRDQYAEMAGY